MRRLKVVDRYVEREVILDAGMIIDETQYDLDYLLRDAPGCFEEVEDIVVKKEEEVVIKQPPFNKAILEPKIDKAPSEQPKESDLTKIVGIGKILQDRLNDEGYFTIEDLQKASDVELLQIRYMTKSILQNIRIYTK